MKKTGHYEHEGIIVHEMDSMRSEDHRVQNVQGSTRVCEKFRVNILTPVGCYPVPSQSHHEIKERKKERERVADRRKRPNDCCRKQGRGVWTTFNQKKPNPRTCI
jgi:hypothetical protein